MISLAPFALAPPSPAYLPSTGNVFSALQKATCQCFSIITISVIAAVKCVKHGSIVETVTATDMNPLSLESIFPCLKLIRC